jgi:hypothetical protein
MSTATHVDPLNQHLNSTKEDSSPAHQHLEQNAPEATTANKTDSEKMDHIAMESARRAENRFANNSERIPGDTIFSK